MEAPRLFDTGTNMNFTCPKCKMNTYISVPARDGEMGICMGKTPHVLPSWAPPDVPETFVSCGFTWFRTEDAKYFA